ncbi:MAG: hypothetical protein K6E53_01430, partial [Lachnospiraceae bacterium]|nr:hypothetical protein [Lachnospiraceae bacterium]
QRNEDEGNQGTKGEVGQGNEDEGNQGNEGEGGQGNEDEGNQGTKGENNQGTEGQGNGNNNLLGTTMSRNPEGSGQGNEGQGNGNSNLLGITMSGDPEGSSGGGGDYNTTITLNEASLTVTEGELPDDPGVIKKIWSTVVNFISEIKYDMWEVEVASADNTTDYAIGSIEAENVTWDGNNGKISTGGLYDYEKELPGTGNVKVFIYGAKYKEEPYIKSDLSNPIFLDIPPVGGTSTNSTTPVDPPSEDGPTLNNATINMLTSEGISEVGWQLIGDAIAYLKGGVWGFAIDVNGEKKEVPGGPAGTQTPDPDKPAHVILDQTWGNNTFPLNSGDKVIVYVYQDDWTNVFWSGGIPVIVPGGSSPIPPEPTPSNGSSDNPGQDGGSDNTVNDDDSNNSSNSGSSNTPETVIAVEKGNVIAGKIYKGQIVEYRTAAAQSRSNGFTGNATTSFGGGNGLEAIVDVDQGGSNFGAYSFGIGTGTAGGSSFGFNSTINNAGKKFSHSTNGVYYPEGTAEAEIVFNEAGVASFADGKTRLPGVYTVLYLDEDGRMAFIRVNVPGGSGSASGEKNSNPGNATFILNPVPDLNFDMECSIITYYGDGNVNGTGTPMGGEAARFAADPTGNKIFTDKVRQEGTYLITYTDKNGNPVYDYIIVPGAGSSGSAGSTGKGNSPQDAVNTGEGDGTPKIGFSTNSIPAFIMGTVVTETPLGGETHEAAPPYEKALSFDENGNARFAVNDMPPGDYGVKYKDYNNIEHEVNISVR